LDASLSINHWKPPFIESWSAMYRSHVCHFRYF